MSNKRDYVYQMMVWLRRQEAMGWFSTFKDYLAKHKLVGNKGVLENEDEESVDGDDPEGEDGLVQVVDLTSQLHYMLAAKLGFPSL